MKLKANFVAGNHVFIIQSNFKLGNGVQPYEI